MAIKKKKETNLYQNTLQPQGMTQGQTFKMPETALVNPEAQKLGLNVGLTDGKINVQDITPKVAEAPPTPTQNIYKGVDISKSFSNKDFLTKEDYEQAKKRAELMVLKGSPSTEQLIQQQQAQFEAQQLAGQVGQFQQLGVEPTGLDVGQAATQGIVGAIPKALGFAATGAAAGALGGTAVLPGVGTAGGAAIGAVAGFVSGLASSMISNFKSQRTDTTNAQKRVLDEGKQNLNDWATLAAADPANRALYIKNFNQQLALIDQAYRQMKLDTSRDVAKFETALPDLAEFEAFYMAQGERDFIVAKMYQSLGVMQDPDYSYQMQELATRRGMYPNGTA